MRGGILTEERPAGGGGLEPHHAPKRQALNANKTPLCTQQSRPAKSKRKMIPRVGVKILISIIQLLRD